VRIKCAQELREIGIAIFKAAGATTENAEGVPGEPEARTRDKRLREGIPMPDATWEAICSVAQAGHRNRLTIGNLGGSPVGLQTGGASPENLNQWAQHQQPGDQQ
jgi:hypothetical protein